jgi:hypothetical protein
MLILEETSSGTNLVVCVRNDGYELDLKSLELYRAVPDDSLEPDDIRVIDETGEDYIYSASYFETAAEIDRSRFRFWL